MPLKIQTKRPSNENRLDAILHALSHQTRRALLARLIEACTARGDRLMVAVIGDVGNAASIALHRRLGFVTIGTVPEAFEHATLGRVGLDIMYLQL